MFLLAGRGFIDPIFSVFIIKNIPGGTLTTVGIATAIYLILRSILRIPISNYLDRTPGEKDDFTALLGGLFLLGICPLALILVRNAWELCGAGSPGIRIRALLRVMASDLFSPSRQRADIF